ncbi:MAG: outer membrane lipoprotein carrier protein LolA [Holosporales bacterium]|jgi:outer membrane lipoprotein-sorting protein|nr:outer membrane lipoprotein carrier protein LolA [Holosporales bacterium]
MIKRLFLSFGIGIAVAWGSGTASAAPLTLDQVEAALNKITTLRARFQQTGRNGNLTTGVFYFKRPGSVRFDYDAPNPHLIISSGGCLYHIDKELKERSELPKANPLYLFLKTTISFRQKGTRVLRFAKKDGIVQLVLSVDKEPGTLTLFFETATLHLQRWVLEDEEHQQTVIDLAECVYGEQFPAYIFERLELPRQKHPS